MRQRRTNSTFNIQNSTLRLRRFPLNSKEGILSSEWRGPEWVSFGKSLTRMQRPHPTSLREMRRKELTKNYGKFSSNSGTPQCG